MFFKHIIYIFLYFDFFRIAVLKIKYKFLRKIIIFKYLFYKEDFKKNNNIFIFFNLHILDKINFK